MHYAFPRLGGRPTIDYPFVPNAANNEDRGAVSVIADATALSILTGLGNVRPLP
jgi:hypothetical protein